MADVPTRDALALQLYQQARELEAVQSDSDAPRRFCSRP